MDDAQGKLNSATPAAANYILPAAKPVVAIVGRQNVGKSTLLNRIAGKPIAIVEDLPGTTRDRVFADATWEGVDFTLIDTGGLEFEGESTVARGTRRQAEIAIADAEAVIFLVDAKDGLLPLDKEIANLLRKTTKPVILAVNKVDNEKMKAQAAEFYQLGFDEALYLSAFHGKGVEELLDRLVSLLPPPPPVAETSSQLIKIAIVGRPHVGKSLLLNALLGKERAIVGTSPGTTRDAIDSLLDFEGQNMLLIDTAGIRRKGRQDSDVEWYSVLRAMRAIDRADIALLVLDATEAGTAQDMHIAGYIQKAAKGIVLLINKWDLVTEKNRDEYTEYIRSRLKFASYAPVHFISAKTGQGIKKILPLANQIYLERTMKLSDEEVNRVVQAAVASHNLPHIGNKPLKVFSAVQSAINPPTFSFFLNNAKMIHFSYERFLENKLRQAFGFNGTPIRLVFKVRG
jgi:GTP-binding protein